MSGCGSSVAQKQAKDWWTRENPNYERTYYMLDAGSFAKTMLP